MQPMVILLSEPEQTTCHVLIQTVPKGHLMQKHMLVESNEGRISTTNLDAFCSFLIVPLSSNHSPADLTKLILHNFIKVLLVQCNFSCSWHGQQQILRIDKGAISFVIQSTN